tara:strand:- start:2 stop:232 length:231 start_codon:yes stop_codon:yes gene_type:complete
MARGRKPARIASKKKANCRRMLGEQEVFPIRCVSRREGMKYDLLGGYVREGRDGMKTIYGQDGRPVPFRSIGILVG